MVCETAIWLSDAQPIVNAGQMRWADTQTMRSGTSSEVLMARAGQHVADAVLELAPAGRVCIVCGPGNNGGDGFAAAIVLSGKGCDVVIILDGRAADLRGEAAIFAGRASEAGIPIVEVCDEASAGDLLGQLKSPALLVDALFGTGLSRPLEGVARTLVEGVNDAGKPVLAVDIASGIHSDNGEVLGVAIRATWTLPIAAYKWGHWTGAGREHAGKILLPADIGIATQTIAGAWQAELAGYRSARVIPEALPARFWEPRPRESHKGQFGHVWVFGGSVGFAGAPRLAARGAFAAGAGLVSIACPESVWPQIATEEVDVMVHPDSVNGWKDADVLLAGPGWGTSGPSRLAELIEAEIPLLVDADGLNRVAADEYLADALANRSALTVMTPHPGEAGRLLGLPTSEVLRNRNHTVVELAKRFRAWVVLKGAGSLICSADGDVALCPLGSPNLAVAGTGDVLAGMISAALARGGHPEDAVPAAVTLHAMAGESNAWYMASGLADSVAGLRRQFEHDGEHAVYAE